MKYIISYSSLLLLAALLFWGCAEVRDDITAPQEVKVHGNDALNANSDKFHSFLVKDEGIYNCQTCHAADYSGGITELSCVTCHPTVQVHQEGINNPTKENFHGKFIADNNQFFECKQCHGNNWSGGVVTPGCVTCHGGIDVHRSGIFNPTNPNFHGQFIRETNWDLTLCSQCHATDYAGGLISPTCLTCHDDTGGPEACNTCHGNFSDPTQIAPPQGTNNETSTTAAAVGAHQLHLHGIAIAQNVACNECHIIPSEFQSAGHIDGSPRAELTFGAFTNLGPSQAYYDFDELTCQNTYCHGNFEFLASESQYPFAYTGEKMEGNNFSPIWNKVNGTQAACGTCHGEINESGQLISALPKGHYGDFSITTCVTCHRSVVNENGEIIDPTKHINGIIDVFD